MDDKKILLKMKNICKSFPGVKALQNVSIELEAGEVHALLGENGAGKSTLIKVLAGIHQADSGEIFIDGEKKVIQNIHHSQELGISIIHQELCLANNMTVSENIFLGKEKTQGFFKFIDKNFMKIKTKEILRKFQLDIEYNDNVDKLTVALQQMVEIAKALSSESKILVMDEPTSSLTDREIKNLFRFINILKEKKVGIIYISHRMEELFQVADKVTVLRDGMYIGTKNIKETSYHELITMMVGRELKTMFTKPKTEVGKTILEVRNINRGKKVRNASFELKEGEVLGFYGLVGSGRTELLTTILGLYKKDSGEIYLNNKLVKINSYSSAIKKGIVIVPEDRKAQGGILIQDITYNITLPVIKKIIKGININKKLQTNIVNNYIDKLRIKTPSPSQLLRNLSGGNQQKVIIAKWLATEPKILILDEPTRGIDVGAKKEIYEIISTLVENGVSVIMISSELPEIVNMSTRVIVMKQGEIVGEVTSDDINQENIIKIATGGR